MSTALQPIEQSEVMDAERLPAQPPTGVYALASMSDVEFAQRLEMMRKGRKRAQEVMRSVMQEGTHFGVIPGTQKPTLLKPGMEVLCNLYNYVANAILEEVVYGNGTDAPQIRARVRCEVHAGSLSGAVVGVGYGSANSWEPRYRWRKASRTCPECGQPAIIEGKQFKPGDPKQWICWKKPDKGMNGCGLKFAFDDSRITEQPFGKAENPDPYELENTLVKMAEKRAKVDATIAATATSDLFTQDVEDNGAEAEAWGRGQGEAGNLAEAAVPASGEVQAGSIPARSPRTGAGGRGSTPREAGGGRAGAAGPASEPSPVTGKAGHSNRARAHAYMKDVGFENSERDKSERRRLYSLALGRAIVTDENSAAISEDEWATVLAWLRQKYEPPTEQ